MGQWDIAAGEPVAGINGINAYKGTIDPAAPAEKYLLRQQIYATGDEKKKAIQPNRWYTLSFYAKTNTEGSKVWSFVYPSCCDTTAGMVVDGVQQGASPSDASVEWTLTETFVRHVVTFKTKGFNKDQYVLFRLPADSHDCLICMPKLEEGTQATEWTTHADDTADIAAERTGFPWDNGLWNETKVYMWNDTRRDFVDYEFDKTFYKFGVKRKGMTIPRGTPPTSASGDSNWEVAHKIQTLVTDTIFGKNANIGGFMATNSQLQSKNGSLTLDGIHGVISLLHEEEGYTWCVKENGVQVMGVEGGRRIEFDPSQKEIRIYNKYGTEAANLSGKTYKDLSEIFGGNAGEFDLGFTAVGSESINAKGSEGLQQRSFTHSIATATTLSASRLNFYGRLTANANTVQTADIGLVDEQGRYFYPNHAAITLYVTTYADSTMATVVQQRREIVNLYTSGNGQHTATLDTISVDVPAGYHVVSLYFAIDAIGSNADSYAEVTWNISRISYGSDFYLSRLFGNGFAYGSSANNYIAAINESDDQGKYYMRHKMVSGNCGYDIYKGTIKIMLGGTWYTMSRKADGTVLLNE